MSEYGFSLTRIFAYKDRISLSYRNQSINLLCKSMDWSLYNRENLYLFVKIPVREEPDTGIFYTVFECLNREFITAILIEACLLLLNFSLNDFTLILLLV